MRSTTRYFPAHPFLGQLTIKGISWRTNSGSNTIPPALNCNKGVTLRGQIKSLLIFCVDNTTRTGWIVRLLSDVWNVYNSPHIRHFCITVTPACGISPGNMRVIIPWICAMGFPHRKQWKRNARLGSWREWDTVIVWTRTSDSPWSVVIIIPIQYDILLYFLKREDICRFNDLSFWIWHLRQIYSQSAKSRLYSPELFERSSLFTCPHFEHFKGFG